jgi:hypothetical protein
VHPLKINEHAAAFGLFHLVYSALDEHLTGAVLKFARANRQQVSASEVRRAGFSRKVRFLKESIKPLKKETRHPNPLAEDLEEMDEAFRNIGDVQKWRNDRTHARVVFRAELTLVDGKGKILPITHDDCLTQIRKASDATFALEGNIKDLTDALRNRAMVHADLGISNPYVNEGALERLKGRTLKR